MLALPVILGVDLRGLHAIWTWRASRRRKPVVGPALGPSGRRIGLDLLSTAIVLSMFVFGTYELAAASGRKGSRGPGHVIHADCAQDPAGQVIARRVAVRLPVPNLRPRLRDNQLVIPANTRDRLPRDCRWT